MLDTNTMLGLHIVNTYYSVVCPFALLIVSFSTENVLNFNVVQLIKPIFNEECLLCPIQEIFDCP